MWLIVRVACMRCVGGDRDGMEWRCRRDVGGEDEQGPRQVEGMRPHKAALQGLSPTRLGAYAWPGGAVERRGAACWGKGDYVEQVEVWRCVVGCLGA